MPPELLRSPSAGTAETTARNNNSRTTDTLGAKNTTLQEGSFCQITVNTKKTPDNFFIREGEVSLAFC